MYSEKQKQDWIEGEKEKELALMFLVDLLGETEIHDWQQTQGLSSVCYRAVKSFIESGIIADDLIQERKRILEEAEKQRKENNDG